MKQENITICFVTTIINIETIKKNIEAFKKNYPNFFFKFIVICPKKDLIFFNDNLVNQAKIISEESIIKLKNFRRIFLSYFNNKKKKFFTKRVNWYYQQCLKISFLFLNRAPLKVIWDADTLILKYIDFFDDKFLNSKNYENLYELHTPYFVTNNIILKKMPNRFNSAINQFTALTQNETTKLEITLEKFLKKKGNKQNWVSHIMAKGISISNQMNDFSLFSEYELINIWKRNQTNFKFSYIRFYRTNKNYRLTENQVKLLKIFNYKHLTYEKHLLNSKKNNIKNNWIKFIIQLIFFEITMIKNFFKNIKKNKIIKNF